MDNLQEAVGLLKFYTYNYFDCWLLAGNSESNHRQHVISTLLGRKVPKSQAGINALEKEFYTQANIQGECHAERKENFIKWAKAQG